MIWIRGDDITIEVQVLDDSYQPIDITGWDFESTLKNLPKHEDSPIFTLGVGSGITITEPLQGKLVIAVPRDKTKNLILHHEYYFDIVGINPANQRFTLKVWQIYVEGGTSNKGLI